MQFIHLIEGMSYRGTWLDKWICVKLMEFNKSKWNILKLGQTIAQDQYRLGEKWIERSPTEKDLGILANEPTKCPCSLESHPLGCIKDDPACVLKSSSSVIDVEFITFCPVIKNARLVFYTEEKGRYYFKGATYCDCSLQVLECCNQVNPEHSLLYPSNPLGGISSELTPTAHDLIFRSDDKDASLAEFWVYV
ncbi:hypothetical protein BTVI_36374 [Pitangus sulphuratus]|nr:hypothetical protein BTVI_36374 [Pitangus sulphuratus]